MEAFKHFDVAGKGKIGKTELMQVSCSFRPSLLCFSPPHLQVLRELGQNLSDAEMGDIMEVLDADRDGYVVLGDFKALMGVN